MFRWISSIALMTFLTSTPAFAQDDEDFFGDEEEESFEEEDFFGDDEEDEPIERGEEQSADDSDDDDFLDDEDEDIDSFSDEEEDEEDLFDEPSTEDEVTQEGADTSKIYRAQVAELKGAAADEEVMAWEAYLETYPNSLFRTIIEERVEELIGQQFGEVGRVSTGVAKGGAALDELNFTNAFNGANVNPRTRVRASLMYGFPSFVGGQFDFEYGILRNLSVHGGFAGGYTGWGLETGVRWAFVKSTRAQLVATLIGDFKLNFGPFTGLFRPQIGFGKILGPVQILLTAGAEIDFRQNASVAIIGDLHLHFRLAEAVALYVEADTYVRKLGREEGAYHFESVLVGFKFYPKMKKGRKDSIQVGVGGVAPVANDYLGYYQAGATVQADWFPEL